MESTTAPREISAVAPTAETMIVNVALRLDEFARTTPDVPAIAEKSRHRDGRNSKFNHELYGVESNSSSFHCPTGYRYFSFQQLSADSQAIAAGLADIGVQPGMRMALLVRPGIDFVSLVFALFRLGAVQVLIDPGMGLRNVIHALAEVQPDGFISAAAVQTVRFVLQRRFPKARFNVVVGKHMMWGAHTLEEIRNRGTRQSGTAPITTIAETPAAIIFTSGSTGPAKGVLYRHGNFDRQVTEIRDFYGMRPGEIDVSCFPLFGLFNAAMGVTSVIPPMDVSRPARVDPRCIIQTVNDWQATQAFGSPAVWNVVGRYCEENKLRLPTLRRVLAAGAPVAASVLERMTACIHPQGDMHTPYGATEALPVASNCASVVLRETQKQTEQGAGVCVGRRFSGIQWRVIRIRDEPICNLADADELPPGEIGELIVHGPVVTSQYVTRTEINAWAKIHNADGGIWHRMGDVGYFDEQNRFWFCGRMSHRVIRSSAAGNAQTMFTIPCEAIFNRHPDVFRSALVGMGTPGKQRPAMVVEPMPNKFPRTGKNRRRLICELKALGQSSSLTTDIDDFFIRKSLPVDVRHNVKINREQLAIWAAKKSARSTRK
jgi:olefin beta-lactone synthetase